MEFRQGSCQKRQDRRVCRRCRYARCGKREKCPRCGGRTEPRIQVNWYINGQRQRQLTDEWKEAEARALLRRIEADYWAGQELGVQRDVGGTLLEAQDAFLRELRGKSDQKQARTALRALAKGIGWDRQVHVIGIEDLRDFRDDGLAVLASATVRSYMGVLRRFFSFLVSEGWIRQNPTARIPLPRATARPVHLSRKEAGHYLSILWTELPTVAPIATIMVLGGLRKGEVINLRREHLDLADRWTVVTAFPGDEIASAWRPKTKSSYRSVPLHPLALAALRRTPVVMRLDGSESPWVFPVVDPRKRKRNVDRKGRAQPVVGDRRSPDTSFLGRKVRKVLVEKSFTREVTIHDLRRTFAVLLQSTGAPDSVIRQALGHRGAGVTELHYLPRRDAEVQRWVDKINIDIPGLK